MHTFWRETVFLITGLLFGVLLVPAALWWIDVSLGLHVTVFDSDSLGVFYHHFLSGLDDPLLWPWLLAPYLLFALVRSLLRPIGPKIRVGSALEEAAARGRGDQVRTLISQGSDVNTRDSHGLTPLHMAAGQGNDDVLRLLLEHGAEVDAAEATSGRTALHLAAAAGHEETSELLIRFGADPDARTAAQETALHLAVAHGHAEIVLLLLKYRARLDIGDKDGITPLQRAEQLRQREIVNLINRHLDEAWPYLRLSKH